jgi:penicillin G amidase
MNLPRLLLRLFLGRRLPLTRGRLSAEGLRHPVTISRDRWGIPFIDAQTDPDAWFALGFCHGQDRSFQLEFYLRAVRGTLAEAFGPDALGADRLARRIGFRRAAEAHLPSLDPDLRADLAAYAAGVNAGRARGCPRRAHELVLLRLCPTPWAPADVLGFLKVQSFVMPANWDAELARYQLLRADGPEALSALDPAAIPPLAPGVAGPAVDRLAEDLASFAEFARAAGGSNNWAVAGSRTRSGRPLLANDPHLPPTCPLPWYLARLQTPRWSAAGATLVGGPAVPIGHNGFVAWGSTAGLVDNTDLFIEEIGPDRRSVRQGDDFVPCPVLRERIAVRGRAPVTEEVLLTPRGPVIGPALRGEVGAVSLRATWLDPGPVEGFLRVHLARDARELRATLSQWPALSQNVVFADTAGTIGWQLMGPAPRRRRGWGLLPAAGWDPRAGWEEAPVPFADMPHKLDPPEDFVATANNSPDALAPGVFLGADWLDDHRARRIRELLSSRTDWDVQSTQELQRDLFALPWREMKDAVLSAVAGDPLAAEALALLRGWDGRASADSPAATVYELFVAEMARRVAKARAPRGWRWALGAGFSQVLPRSLFGVRRVGHLVRLLREQPPGWLPLPWPVEVADALAGVVRSLRSRYGRSPASWAWGRVRPLTFQHPLGVRPLTARLFNLGPVAGAGDTDTVAQSSVYPPDATAPPGFVASLRVVLDVGAWDDSSFALPGGQSGNPLSPHYDDLFTLWQRGEGVPIPWSAGHAERAETLELTPGGTVQAFASS